MLWSYCILKERCHWFDGLLGAISIIGVLLIARPEFIFGKYGQYGKKHVVLNGGVSGSSLERSYLLGCIISLLYGAGRGLLFTMHRQCWWDTWEIKPDPTTLAMYPSIMGAIITPTLMLLSGNTLIVPSTTYGIYSLFACGVFGLLGLLTIALALRTMTAPTFGLIRNLDIVWAYMFQYFFNHVPPSLWTVGGSVIIVITTVVVCCREKFNDAICSDQQGYEKCNIEENEDEDGK